MSTAWSRTRSVVERRGIAATRWVHRACLPPRRSGSLLWRRSWRAAATIFAIRGTGAPFAFAPTVWLGVALALALRAPGVDSPVARVVSVAAARPASATGTLSAGRIAAPAEGRILGHEGHATRVDHSHGGSQVPRYRSSKLGTPGTTSNFQTLSWNIELMLQATAVIQMSLHIYKSERNLRGLLQAISL